jgi:uncharacterized surface protein with fasciclin (FAS1) repeats
LSAAVKAKDIQRGINSATPTLNGTAFVSNFNYGTTTDGNETSYGVSINGSGVTRADKMATNGIIYAVDAVIFPAFANTVATLQANLNYSLLVAAVVRAGLAEALSSPGPFTVFAPNNEAFIDYLGIARKEKFISNETNQEKERDHTKEAIMMDAVNAINAASPAALASILTYHVTGSWLLSNNLSAGRLPHFRVGILPFLLMEEKSKSCRKCWRALSQLLRMTIGPLLVHLPGAYSGKTDPMRL